MTRQEQICNAGSKYSNGNEETRCNFIDGAHWADKTMVKRAVQWLKENLVVPEDDFLERFKKQMMQ